MLVFEYVGSTVFVCFVNNFICVRETYSIFHLDIKIFSITTHLIPTTPSVRSSFNSLDSVERTAGKPEQLVLA